jgi:hypothetical protein
MLRAMLAHRVKDEVVKKGGKDTANWIIIIQCTCGKATEALGREGAWEQFAKHVITAAFKEGN